MLCWLTIGLSIVAVVLALAALTLVDGVTRDRPYESDEHERSTTDKHGK